MIQLTVGRKLDENPSDFEIIKKFIGFEDGKKSDEFRDRQKNPSDSEIGKKDPSNSKIVKKKSSDSDIRKKSIGF